MNQQIRLTATTTIVTLLLSACAATTDASRTAPAASNVAKQLDQVLAGAHRSTESRARDKYRHPKETLLFFGLEPTMRVAEIWPGANGWYAEVVAPLVAGKGQYYAVQWEANPQAEFIAKGIAAFNAKVAASPAAYGNMVSTELGPNRLTIAPAGSLDMVLTFRNIHNWMSRDFQAVAPKAMFDALKPGGILGVVEHRGNAAIEQDPKAKNGYVNEDYAIKLFTDAGFELLAKSEINANPQDTKDYEQGVWTLPPTYRLGETDRDKYAAIGESDRFTLKFRKPKK
ncbi:MAG: class I SAM-dependent methyltransferase [Proteobacteria bacterium]|nr:class I SAM-dependent methyltransferase [Pseudomonadota bacterium]